MITAFYLFFATTAVAGELGNELFVAAQGVGNALSSVVTAVADAQGILYGSFLTHTPISATSFLLHRVVVTTVKLTTVNS